MGEKKIPKIFSHENHNYNEIRLFAAWILITRIERKWEMREKKKQRHRTKRDRVKQRTMFGRDKNGMTLSSWQLTNESANRKNTHTAHRAWGESESASERAMTKQSVRAYNRWSTTRNCHTHRHAHTHTWLGTMCPNRCVALSRSMLTVAAATVAAAVAWKRIHHCARTNGVSTTTVREFCTVIPFDACMCANVIVFVWLYTQRKCLCSQSHRQIFPRQYNKMALCSSDHRQSHFDSWCNARAHHGTFASTLKFT